MRFATPVGRVSHSSRGTVGGGSQNGKIRTETSRSQTRSRDAARQQKPSHLNQSAKTIQNFTHCIDSLSDFMRTFFYSVFFRLILWTGPPFCPPLLASLPLVWCARPAEPPGLLFSTFHRVSDSTRRIPGKAPQTLITLRVQSSQPIPECICPRGPPSFQQWTVSPALLGLTS